MANGPSLSNFQKYRVTRPGQKEAIRWSFYDSLLMPLAGINRLDFFQTPQGQGITTEPGAVVGAPKTIHDTNMDLQGALPRFQDFQLESIEIAFFPGASAAANTFIPQVVPVIATISDVITFRSGGALILNITSKPYLQEAGLARFPPKQHLDLSTGQALSYADQVGRPYFVDPAIMLLSNQNFNVSLPWPAPVPMPSGFNGRVRCTMEGILYRNTQ